MPSSHAQAHIRELLRRPNDLSNPRVTGLPDRNKCAACSALDQELEASLDGGSWRSGTSWVSKSRTRPSMSAMMSRMVSSSWPPSSSRSCRDGTGNGVLGEEAAGPQAHVDQPDQDGDLDEGSDDAGQRLARGHSEDADRYGDGELEVVAGSGEGDGGGPLVVEPEPLVSSIEPPHIRAK